MSKNSDYSRKILKILSENKAVSLPDLVERFGHSTSVTKNASDQAEQNFGSFLQENTLGATNHPVSQKTRYAVNRSLRNLVEGGFVENHFSGQNNYARLTPSGRRRAIAQKLEDRNSLVSNWDGKWRMIILDLPESRKSERESLRYLLKKAGFVCLKNSVWVSPLPYEYLFMNIKKDLGLTSEMIIITTSHLDADTEQELVQVFLQK